MKSLHKLLKNHGGIVCVCTYLVTWFLFGYLYCYIANVSYGQSFVFQEDILLQSKNTEFQKKLNIHLDNNITKELFLNYDKTFNLMKITKNENLITTFNLNSTGINPIGTAWANYYISKWLSEGYNFCSAKVLARNQKIIDDTSYCEILFSVSYIPEDAYKDYLVKEPVYLPEVYSILVQKHQQFHVWIKQNEFDLQNKNWSFTGNENTYEALDLGKYFISNAINYFDDAIEIIYNYETKSQFKYPLIDFLYFSAVTITTLGYGDILPNSSWVRGLVMSETIIGAIILAISISFLYDRIKSRH
jgi:voltage-gated potassium channel